MKKLKLAALLTAFTLSVTAFAACGKKDDDKGSGDSSAIAESWETANFQDVFKTTYVADDDEAVKSPLNATKLSDFTGYTIKTYSFDINYSYGRGTQNNYPIVQFSRENSDGTTDFAVYNNSLGKTLIKKNLPAGTTANIKLYIGDANGYYWYYRFGFITESKEGTTEQAYAFDGTELNGSIYFGGYYDIKDDDGEDVSKAITIRTYDENNDETDYTFDANSGKRIVKQTETGTKPVNEFKDFEVNYSFEGKKYDYVFDYDGIIYVYAKGDYKVAKSADFRGSYDDVEIMPLANETFLVQLTRKTDGDYDYLALTSEDICKYELKSYLYDPEKDTKTEVKVNYLLKTVVNPLKLEKYDEEYKPENLGVFYRIVDKKLDSKPRTAVLKNNLEVCGVIDNYVVDQYEVPKLISDGVFEVVSKNYDSTDTYYLDGTGKVIGKALKNSTPLNHNSPLVRTAQSIYNTKTLDKIIDFKGENYTVTIEEDDFFGNVVISKNYDSGEQELLLITSDSSTPKSLFTVTDNLTYHFDIDGYYYVKTYNDKTAKYTVNYYNTNGKLMFKFTNTSGSVQTDTMHKIEEDKYAYIFGYYETDAEGNMVYNYYRAA